MLQAEALERRLHPALHARHRAAQLGLRLPDVRRHAAASSTPSEPLFRTGWFVESLATQTLVIFVIRTADRPWASRPSRALAWSVVACAVVGALLPFTPLAPILGFVPLPPLFFGALLVMIVTYLGLVEVTKRWFYRRYPM